MKKSNSKRRKNSNAQTVAKEALVREAKELEELLVRKRWKGGKENKIKTEYPNRCKANPCKG